MIRQVMDIYTMDDKIDINFAGTEIFGLQIIGRNVGQELGFIHEGKLIKVNISNLNWPNEIRSNSKNSLKKHVKMEIKFFMNLGFRKTISNWLKFVLLIKKWGSLYAYLGEFEIKGKIENGWIIRPEFSVKLPLGLKMLKHDELNLTVNRYYPKGSRTNCKRIYPYIIQCDITDPYVESIEINLKEPDVTRVDGKRLYTFVIDDKEYNDLLLKTREEDCSLLYHGEYNVVHENRFIWIPIFGIILVPFVIIVAIQSILGNNGSISQATVIVAVLSYFILFLTLKREEYELPLEKVVTLTTGALLVVLAIWILSIILEMSGINSIILLWLHQFWSFLF